MIMSESVYYGPSRRDWQDSEGSSLSPNFKLKMI